MATSLSTRLTLVLEALFRDTLDLDIVKYDLSMDKGNTLADGTGANQADVLWTDTRTLTETSEELDLAGSLTNAIGVTATFVKVKVLVMHNKSTTSTENLTIGGAAANQFATWVGNSSDKLVIGPDGLLLLWNPIDGYTVTADTGDKLKIDAGSDTITYDIAIIGTSA